MRNYVQPGETLNILAPATVVSGAGVLFGSMVGIAMHDAASGAPLEIRVKGEVIMPKAAGTFAPGALLYFDNATGRATATATANRPLGFHAGTVSNAGAAGTDIAVLLWPSTAITL